MKNWKIISQKNKNISPLYICFIYMCVFVCVCVYIYRKDIEIFVKKNVFLIFI